MIQRSKLSGTKRDKTLKGNVLSSFGNATARSSSVLTLEESWQAAFDALVEPVWLMDAGCRILRCNQAAKNLFGNKIIGRHGWEVAPLEGKQVLECSYSGMKRGSSGESTELSVGPRWFNVSVDPLFDRAGKIAGGVQVMRDITERKMAEKKLQEANLILERCVEARTGELLAANRSLRENEERLRLFIGNAPVAIAMFDRGMRCLAASWRWLSDYGLKGQAVIGESHYKIFPETPERWKKGHRRALAGEVVRNEEDCFKRRDGTVQWLRWEFRPWFAAEKRVDGLIIFTEDITERRRSEQLLQHANRTLHAIRACHEAMLRARTEKELLEEVCRIIVETGGERMVWIGFAEHNAGKTVRPMADAGVNMDYVASSAITWADTRRGRGPVGTAIRTGKACICQNTQTDPQFAPWRTEARRYGYGSVIALPLMAEKQCMGALSIYAPEPYAFDAGEQLLLTDLANDLAFGINALRQRNARERLENEMVQSIEHEQERIGRDLHDGICQMLVGAKFRSVYLEKILNDKFPKAAAEAKALEGMLNQTVEQVRDLARGLNPVKVTSDGLELALQKLAAGVEHNSGPRCFCNFQKPVRIGDHNVANQLYRIAQEAVQNAVKHAAAKNISITLAREHRRITLIVKDDGKGIPPVLKKNGMGLDNMRTRASLISGEMEIRRRKNGGTSVMCILPPHNRRNDHVTS